MANEDLDKAAYDYIRSVVETMPSHLRGHDVVKLIGVIVTAFSPDVNAAMSVMTTTSDLLGDYYASGGDSGMCMCDHCTATRKAGAH